MGRVNWGGFTFDSDWLVQTKKCITCRDDFPDNEEQQLKSQIGWW